LPGIAEDRLRDELARHGEVASVDVRAFPALELLWHRADRVVVHLRSYRAGTAPFADSLSRTRDTGDLDARTDLLMTGPLLLRDARLVKRGDELLGRATVTDRAIRAVLPSFLDVQPVASGRGQLVLQGTASMFGLSASLRARLLVSDGKLLVEPDVPLGGFAHLTVFADPRIAVQGVGARAVPGGFVVTARAALR
jgi:hypothetical protein